MEKKYIKLGVVFLILLIVAIIKRETIFLGPVFIPLIGSWWIILWLQGFKILDLDKLTKRVLIFAPLALLIIYGLILVANPILSLFDEPTGPAMAFGFVFIIPITIITVTLSTLIVLVGLIKAIIRRFKRDSVSTPNP